jgi:hypothetical protein
MRLETVMRAVKWLAFGGIGMVIAGMAKAGPPNGVAVSVEFWVGLGFSVVLALVAGYARGIEKRVAMVEFDNRQQQSKISELREMVKGDYHPKDEVHDQFSEIKSSIQALHRRLDYIAAGRSGATFPGE